MFLTAKTDTILMSKKADHCEQVLMALRRITRAIDLHSRRLVQSHGLTGPQALLLKSLLDGGETPVGALAQRVSLSQATVTDILNRLEKRGLVHRVRSEVDRRRVYVRATEASERLLENSPPLLQEQFAERFDAMEEWEQTLMLSMLQRVAVMMDARDLSVSPMLTPGPVTAPPEAINEMEESAIVTVQVEAIGSGDAPGLIVSVLRELVQPFRW